MWFYVFHLFTWHVQSDLIIFLSRLSGLLSLQCSPVRPISV